MYPFDDIYRDARAPVRWVNAGLVACLVIGGLAFQPLVGRAAFVPAALMLMLACYVHLSMRSIEERWRRRRRMASAIYAITSSGIMIWLIAWPLAGFFSGK